MLHLKCECQRGSAHTSSAPYGVAIESRGKPDHRSTLCENSFRCGEHRNTLSSRRFDVACASRYISAHGEHFSTAGPACQKGVSPALSTRTAAIVPRGKGDVRERASSCLGHAQSHQLRVPWGHRRRGAAEPGTTRECSRGSALRWLETALPLQARKHAYGHARCRGGG